MEAQTKMASTRERQRRTVSAVGTSAASSSSGNSHTGVGDAIVAINRRLPWEAEFSLGSPGRTARIEVGSVGDHRLVRAFLASLNVASDEDFTHWLDDPMYEPTDRLLVRSGDRMVGHVHFVRRPLVWSEKRMPAVGINDLAVLPELVDSPCRRKLLLAAEAQAREDGALVATLRCRRGDPWIAELGWIPCPSHAVTQASTREVLAYLTPPRISAGRRRTPTVRLWRRVELQALASIYRMAMSVHDGGVWRNEPYWQWLLSRKVQDLVLVAEVPTDRKGPPEIAGYAMTRCDNMIELVTVPGEDQAAVELLRRSCRDAIELGFESIAVHAPSDCPLHELLLTVGGAYTSGGNTPSGELFVRLLVGQLVVGQAISDGRLNVATEDAKHLLHVLFPHRRVWQSPLDSRVPF